MARDTHARIHMLAELPAKQVDSSLMENNTNKHTTQQTKTNNSKREKSRENSICSIWNINTHIRSLPCTPFRKPPIHTCMHLSYNSDRLSSHCHSSTSIKHRASVRFLFWLGSIPASGRISIGNSALFAVHPLEVESYSGPPVPPTFLAQLSPGNQPNPTKRDSRQNMYARNMVGLLTAQNSIYSKPHYECVDVHHIYLCFSSSFSSNRRLTSISNLAFSREVSSSNLRASDNSCSYI